MRIFIPSRGRYNNVETLKFLDDSVREHVTVVVHASEEQHYRLILDKRVEIQPLDYDTIDQKRHMIGQIADKRREKKFVMLDDDLNFLRRVSSSGRQQVTATRVDIVEMLKMLDQALDTYCSVGVASREDNTKIQGPSPLFNECYRVMRVAAFRTKNFLSVEHCRVPVMEDHDVQLQLLRSGKKNAVSFWWQAGQKSTNTSGGCSLWRTKELHESAARRLAELHPELVTLRQKQNKTDKDGFGTRTEVTIQWKKALGYDT